MSNRIVIAGAGGQAGSCLAAEAVRRGRDVLALTSSQWDITDPQAAEQIVQTGDVVINCAAYTNVDAAEGDEPSTILSKVSRLVSVDKTGQLATILCVLVDAEEHVISITSAGHLPPLLIDADGSRYLESELGLPIGVEAGADYPARRLPLPDAGTIVAFTDGLVERRGESIDAGLERLRTAATPNGELRGLMDQLVAAGPGGGGEDDIAIVGVRWRT